MVKCVLSILNSPWVLAIVPGILLYLLGRWHQKRSIDKKSKDIDRVNVLSEDFRERTRESFPSSQAYYATNNQPWLRTKGEYNKFIVRDTYDNQYPNGQDWAKLGLFQVTKDGIAFFDPSGLTGYQIYKDDKGRWDALHDLIVPCKWKGLEKVEKMTYCTSFVPFSDITNIDWDSEEYYNLITLYTPFKKTKRKRKKLITYWCESGSLLYPFDKKKRKNFKSLKWRLFPRLMKKWSYSRMRKFNRKPNK